MIPGRMTTRWDGLALRPTSPARHRNSGAGSPLPLLAGVRHPATLERVALASPSMTRRSRGREVALQLLFQHDLNPRVPRPTIERFAAERLRDPTLTPFC